LYTVASALEPDQCQQKKIILKQNCMNTCLIMESVPSRTCLPLKPAICSDVVNNLHNLSYLSVLMTYHCLRKKTRVNPLQVCNSSMH